MARRYRTLWGYIAREFLISFAVAFSFFFVVFFINQLLLMAEDILSRKAAAGDVARLVVFAMPAIIAMSFPFGSLVGALMAAGRLASDAELLVMRASGISRRAIMAPFAALGLAFSLVSFAMNDYFLPLGTINYAKLYRRMVSASPALELGPYAVKRYRDTVIVTGPVEGDDIRDLVILDSAPGGGSRVISASRARLSDRGDASGTILLSLEGVFVQESSPAKPERFEYSEASRMDYHIALASFADFGSGIGPREMSSRDLLKEIRVKEAALASRLEGRAEELRAKETELMAAYEAAALRPDGLYQAMARLSALADAYRALEGRPLRDRSLDIYRLEYYKKFSIPAGALAFVFLAFPLGARARKSGRGVGFGVGLLVSLAYWGLLIGGQTLGLRSRISPFWAMWAPNALVIAAALPFLLSRGES